MPGTSTQPKGRVDIQAAWNAAQRALASARGDKKLAAIVLALCVELEAERAACGVEHQHPARRDREES